MATASQADAADLGLLANNFIHVQSLQSTLSRAETNVDLVPRLLKRIDHTDAWRHWFDPEKGHYQWNAAQFREFIESPRPGGCQTPLHVLERLVRGTDAWEVFLKLTRGEQGAQPGEVRNPAGTNQHAEDRINRNNITVNPDGDHPATLPLSQGPPRVRDYGRESKQGTSVSYALRRLGNHRPDLLDRVKAGELTPNAAMVTAGFRPKAITIPAEPAAAARRLGLHFTGDDLDALIAALEALRGH